MEKQANRYHYHKDGTLPRNGEIFVFGSNLGGRHGAGAAKAALQFGAKYGHGIGLVGNSYALPTKDGNIQSLSLDEIQQHVDAFVVFAEKNLNKTFFVTRVGCGLANFSDSQIAPMFRGAPMNCNFAEQWQPYLEFVIM